MKDVYLTFDIDNTNYFTNSIVDEFSLYVDRIFDLLKKEDIGATWFVRIDEQVESISGVADKPMLEHSKLISKMKSNGHDFGWHYHSYVKKETNWSENFSEEIVIKGVQKYAPIAKSHNLKYVRLGWGYQSNAIVQTLNQLGFVIDSTAIPRPRYSWTNEQVNWDGTSNEFYHPSRYDYRVNGMNSLDILEVPITTTIIHAPYDNQIVKRYINPCYCEHIFINAIETLEDNNDPIVMICHPYELFSFKLNFTHELMSFSTRTFIKNLRYLKQKGYLFKVFSDII